MAATATITVTAVGSLVAGAVLGVACQELFRVVRESKSRCSNFKNALHSLEYRIDVLTPMIKEMDIINQELNDCKRKEITRLFLQQLKKAEALVSQCSNIHRWNLYKKKKYEKRLMELDSSLKKLSDVLQVGEALDIQRLKLVLQEISD